MASKPVPVRADGAGASHSALIADISRRGWEFSIGFAITTAVRTAITTVPEWAWQVACNADGDLREPAGVTEITGLLDPAFLATWQADCPALRVLLRRERPHPGAQLGALIEESDGYRYQATITNTRRGRSRSWMPGTGRTPGSRTGSGPGRTPVWVIYRPGTRRSTPSGSSSR